MKNSSHFIGGGVHLFMNMPILNLQSLPSTLTEEQKIIANMIVANQGKNKGRLRAAKPKVDPTNPITGKAAYVWRMVAFQLVSSAPYCCMPISAEFDLPYTTIDGRYCSLYEARESGSEFSYRARQRAMAKELDALVNAIVDTVPRQLQHSFNRWAKALGY